MNRKKNIIMIGFMGCGKSSVGMRLSYRLRMPFVDTDKEIQRRQGRTVREIFETEGEAAFRNMETQLLQELSERKQTRIVSVGGGTPAQPQNQELLRQGGIVVYLRIRPETVWERLQHDTTRPLLQCENPKERIQTLMAERQSAYEKCADIIVDVDGRSMEEVLDHVQNALRLPMRPQDKQSATQKPIAQTPIAAQQPILAQNQPSAAHQPTTTLKSSASQESVPHRLLVINGPNLNFLGIREKAVYGTQDYNYLLGLIAQKAQQCKCDIQVFQSNHEGAIIDRIQAAYFDGTEGIVINPGAYTHYSYAIHDALASIQAPKCEIHISDITKREAFRRVSVTAPACDHQIYGQGLDGYLQAIDFVLQRINGDN